MKWADKSTTSYDMLDFKSYIKSLTRKYLLTERHMLKLKGILLQNLKFNCPICPLQIFYITSKIEYIIAYSRFIRPFLQFFNKRYLSKSMC